MRVSKLTRELKQILESQEALARRAMGAAWIEGRDKDLGAHASNRRLRDSSISRMYRCSG
jgi:hypothetical protein